MLKARKNTNNSTHSTPSLASSVPFSFPPNLTHYPSLFLSHLAHPFHCPPSPYNNSKSSKFCAAGFLPGALVVANPCCCVPAGAALMLAHVFQEVVEAFVEASEFMEGPTDCLASMGLPMESSETRPEALDQMSLEESCGMVCAGRLVGWLVGWLFN